MNNGHKANLIKLWNRHRNIDQVVAKSKLDADAVTKFLSNRPGYPGHILTGNAVTQHRLGGKIKAKNSQYGTVYLAPVTLPRVRCLEGAE